MVGLRRLAGGLNAEDVIARAAAAATAPAANMSRGRTEGRAAKDRRVLSSFSRCRRGKSGGAEANAEEGREGGRGRTASLFSLRWFWHQKDVFKPWAFA